MWRYMQSVSDSAKMSTTVNSPMACVEQPPHLNFIEEPIPDNCDDAPTPVSAKCPRDIAILSF
jgi:hypothetical protein